MEIKLEYLYIAKAQNVENGPYCIGWTKDITKRLRGPRPEQSDLDLVVVVPIISEAIQEAHSRLYGHLWEYTKGNIPWFYTDLATILKYFRFVQDYFEPEDIVVRKHFSEEFKNKFTFMYDFT